MDNLPPTFDAIANLEAARKIAQTVYKRFGRPPGAKSYGATSIVGRSMKVRGISWVDELIDSYIIYKQALKDGKTADPKLLDFWMIVLPYITVKMIDKPHHGKPKPTKRKPKISHAAIEALAKAEGRRV